MWRTAMLPRSRMQRYSKRSCLWSMSKRLSGRWTKLSENRLLPIQTMCTRYVKLWWLKISHVHTFNTQFKFRYVRKPIFFHIQFNIFEKKKNVFGVSEDDIHWFIPYEFSDIPDCPVLLNKYFMKLLTNHIYFQLKYISAATIFQSLHFLLLTLLEKPLRQGFR